MKKVIFVLALLFSAAWIYAAPILPDVLPLPPNYSSDLVLTNVISTFPVCKLRCDVTNSTITFTNNHIDVTRSTITFTNNHIDTTYSSITFTNPHIDVTYSTITFTNNHIDTTYSSITFTNPSIDVTGSTISIANMPIVNVTGSTMTFTNPSIDVTGSSVSIANMPIVNVTGSTMTFTNSSIDVTYSTVTFTNPSINVTGSSVSIANMPSITVISMPNVSVTGSTITIKDDRYYQKVSSGTSGKLTGVTSAAIVVTENVYSWSFKYRNLTNTESTATINPDLYGTDIPLFDGDADSESPGVPKPVTFSITMPVESTMTYVINTLK